MGAGRRLAIVAAAAVLAACGGPAGDRPPARMAAPPAATAGATTVPPTTVPVPVEPAGPAPGPGDTDAARAARATAVPPAPAAAPATAATPEAEVEVAYRVEVRSPDPALAGFPAEVDRVLGDPRGWRRAGFRLVNRPDAPFAVLLAEPDDAQELCRPYDVYRRYSCQNGPLVVINAERWRLATPQWTGDLATYREMLVNHELGHLLGMRHPAVDCPEPGRPAPLMAQQSTELDGCLPNPWPLDAEVARAARHDLPLAPPYDR